jgi:hypothetical protein
MLSTSKFYREVRRFCVQAPVWSSDVVRHEVLPDERFDLSLVAYRVYGSRNEFHAVMAAAGIDRYDRPLEQQTIVLPSRSMLEQIKAATGFKSA